ncbi:uncharacterized protein EV420DRAFT_1486915 [Desarmillaria tabescens]|uniref:Uncharacterized protein n=1 Tax=Armillaria tabescens TaxID=1929756 RepID=A0AA39ML57_ARMTA|nr:uncharacterized protein EV420DRAFT_1486915 [Desarmillaria tabescens]KAK0437749.1 hypothetical protein EV420DRAFT_1486915 [Desarmillaria tabescens]
MKRKGQDEDPEKLVYNTAMSLSPSTNFICRDWVRSSGVHAFCDKERLLALIPRETNHQLESLSIFQDPWHIQSMCLPSDLVDSEISVLFDVDTGQIAEQSPPLILQCFPHMPASYTRRTFYQTIDHSVQIVRFVLWENLMRDNEGTFELPDTSRYEVIDRHGSGHHDVFISILNTQTSQCENYLFLGGDAHVVVQYAHGLFIVHENSGTIHKVELAGTQAGCKEWIVLDGWTDSAHANNAYMFTVTGDGSRLLGLTTDWNKRGGFSLREWETSTGFQSDSTIFIEGIRISPDGSKVAVADRWCLFGPAFIIPAPSRRGIRVPIKVGDVKCLTWFPDSDQIVYLRRWHCGHQHCHKCYDLVVQRLMSGQSTMINRWYEGSVHNILVTADGSKVITQDNESFRTWDISDL